MPSTFIPFCSIDGNMDLIGQKIDKFSHPVCTHFRPRVLDGQVCYQLDLQDVQDKIRLSKGEENGLTFVMDYNEDRMINLPNSSTSTDEALIYVDTLGKNHMIIN